VSTPVPSTLTAALAATATGTSWIPVHFEAAFAGAACVGEALTVSILAGDNLSLHEALGRAAPSQVLVVSVVGSDDAGHWGGLMTRAAAARGLRGLVIDGSVRDRPELRSLGFPIFFRSTCPRKARKRDHGTVGERIEIGGVDIEAGDLVVADEDGVVIVPRARVDAVEQEVAAITLRESEIERGLRASGSFPTLT
jgi:4-hydroxy-4-methyl-2-oxoglutarate aldolase